jgi:hypothetical protein
LKGGCVVIVAVKVSQAAIRPRNYDFEIVAFPSTVALNEKSTPGRRRGPVAPIKIDHAEIPLV